MMCRHDLIVVDKDTGDQVGERGFTLIEMMISMAMGLILIAGIASIFASMGKTSSVVSEKTEPVPYTPLTVPTSELG